MTNVVYQMMMASFFLVLALYLQDGRGLSALESGLIFLPLGLGYFAASAVSAKLALRLGRQVLALGALWCRPAICCSRRPPATASAFYHALGSGSYPHAFALALVAMAALGVAGAALVQLFPRTS